MINWNSYETPPLLLRVRKGKKYEVQLEGGKKYKMDKLLWDAMAASAITITMEDFFSTFLKKKTTKRNYVAMWLFYFIYHMTIMNMLNGWVRTGIRIGTDRNFLSSLIACFSTFGGSLFIKMSGNLLVISDVHSSMSASV